VIVGVSLCLGILRNILFADRIPWVRPQVQWANRSLDPPPTPKSSPIASGTLEKIELQEALDLFVAGKTLFVDARSKDEFVQGHIAGAINLPVEKARESGLGPVLTGLSLDFPIVTYCDGGNCEASIDLAQLLKEYGYTDVAVFYGGWEQWQKAGYRTAEGAG
jgi:rhodanese-related sulfurtransferase